MVMGITKINWISVEDKLPKDRQQILVYIQENESHGIFEVCHYYENCEFSPRKFSCYDHFQYVVEEDVSHWMPLKEPK